MLKFRFADKNDVDLIFRWSNEKVTRDNSYNTNEIEYQSHLNWFYRTIINPDIKMYVFMNENGDSVGLVRIENYENDKSKISISVDSERRGLGLGTEMIKMATDEYLKRFPEKSIEAFIFKNNEISKRSFIKAGFRFLREDNIKGISSVVYILDSK